VFKGGDTDNDAAFRALAKIGKLDVTKTETFPLRKVLLESHSGFCRNTGQVLSFGAA
jgi:hypothetical protein